jgi:arginine/lysine/ornithine decarboxylase
VEKTGVGSTEIAGETEEVELECAEGRICARACGFFPPCLPFIQKGERVKRSQIERLKNAKATFGLTDKKITVVKE